jgi:hypothetical protein
MHFNLSGKRVLVTGSEKASDPVIHVNYAEAVVPIRDGLPKLKEFPAEVARAKCSQSSDHSAHGDNAKGLGSAQK